MPAKRKSESKSAEPPAIPGLADGLRLVLAPVATILAQELVALLAAEFDGRKRKTLERIAEVVSQALPDVLPKTFARTLLASDEDDARGRREVLMYMLCAVDVPTSLLRQELNAPVEPSQVATNADDGRVSAAEVAKLLNVSPAYVRKLATAGKLGDVGSAATGETMFELRAVQAYRQEQKRRKGKRLAKMVDAAGLARDADEGGPLDL
jgi:hypothetical protein